jgi:S-adenosylmethionine:diacylglycerol 3-amino-3-carboxypropyl transferase
LKANYTPSSSNALELAKAGSLAEVRQFFAPKLEPLVDPETLAQA